MLYRGCLEFEVWHNIVGVENASYLSVLICTSFVSFSCNEWFCHCANISNFKWYNFTKTSNRLLKIMLLTLLDYSTIQLNLSFWIIEIYIWKSFQRCEMKFNFSISQYSLTLFNKLHKSALVLFTNISLTFIEKIQALLN